MRYESLDEIPGYLRDINEDLFEIPRNMPTPKGSKLEQHFAELWSNWTEVKLETEYQFADDRRWRLDYAHPATKVGVECEGGVWSNGRHVRGQGFIDDCNKYNTAAAQGWTIFRLPAELITTHWVLVILGTILEKEKGNG